MSDTAKRPSVALFIKDSGGRLLLWSLIVMETETKHDRSGTYVMRKEYNVERSRKFGYLFDNCGFGGSGPIPVEGIYFASGDIPIKEGPCQLVDGRDKQPWRSKKTRAIRLRNRTRRLRVLPKAFDLKPGWDLLDWLENNAIQQDAVWCSICRDFFPGENSFDHCEHIWWCDNSASYSTPTERCKCKDREECYG